MKLYLALVCLALVGFVAHTEARRETLPQCPGQPIAHSCNIRRDLGHDRYDWCKDFAMPEMWYYNILHRSCNKMIFLGCGGNFNRFCTEEECERTCLTSDEDKE
ncbi:kunitz-type serine protease inhibitor 28-like [Drosophila novamexicana]|uniref:kunitz-type serine protease inhibitor 28-like n=1 Tax=Drosophila novamexicana TaxID=47314 RepID=UPI0011E5CE34|nr:kunitz-type serine protease inhibitor 28-like [Drosophila novamexicana]